MTERFKYYPTPPLKKGEHKEDFHGLPHKGLAGPDATKEEERVVQDSNVLIDELMRCNCNTCAYFVRDLDKLKSAEFKDMFFGKCSLTGDELRFSPLSWMDDLNRDCHKHRRTGRNFWSE